MKAKATTSLFASPKVKRPHAAFNDLRQSSIHQATRDLIDAIFAEAGDVDGNFVVDFQGDGFQSRLFELACFAYLRECGLTIDRDHSRPDFFAWRGEQRVAIEAVSLNPTAGRDGDISIRNLMPISDEESTIKSNEELPIRLRDAFARKLEGRYWDEAHCQGLPFVLAIAPFHEPGSVGHVDESLARYLYGVERHDDWTMVNGLLVRESTVKNHSFGRRTIVSDFFANEPGAEHVSAVLWCNQFTTPKFFRIAAKAGLPTGVARAEMSGFCRSGDGPIEEYGYSLVHAPVETWARGVTIMLNPRASAPLARGLLGSTCRFELRAGALSRDVDEFHPMTSFMRIVGSGNSDPSRSKNSCPPPIR